MLTALIVVQTQVMLDHVSLSNDVLMQDKQLMSVCVQTCVQTCVICSVVLRLVVLWVCFMGCLCQ